MITFDGAGKTYRPLLGGRSVSALEDLSLALTPGEVFGVAGPNGAGKSTLISLALGFLDPTRGTVRIGGERPRAWVERHGTAYLAELVALPPRWTVEATLARCATLAGIPAGEVRRRAAESLEHFGLEEHRAKQVSQLSKGTLQRLGLAQALLGDSDLVVLDEPTHGLDPVWTLRFRDIVGELRRASRVILIASHNLDELERLADRVAILSQGRLQRIVTSGAGARGGAYRLTLGEAFPRLSEFFPDAVAVEGRRLEFQVSGELPQLNGALARLLSAGGLVSGFIPEQSNLETAFHDAIGGGRP